jgi:hypothetical protein
MEAPLFFIHYGPSTYLRRALRCARASNPEKRIILLGDDTNRHAARGCAEYVPFADYAAGPAIREFDSVFKIIQGERHRFNKHGGVETWLRFVFRRWFIVENFIHRESVTSFWTFDSDTLILAPLAPRETRFAGFEASTQCRDACLNGWIGSSHLVSRYVRCMTELFRNQDFLEAQEKRLQREAGLAFNEMDAFCEFRRREAIETKHAAQPCDGEAFDDALAFDAAYEAAALKIFGRIDIKRLWTDCTGALYTRRKASGEYVRLLTCNMSWLPDYLWFKLEKYCLTPRQDASVGRPAEHELVEIDLSQPLADKLFLSAKKNWFALRKSLYISACLAG